MLNRFSATTTGFARTITIALLLTVFAYPLSLPTTLAATAPARSAQGISVAIPDGTELTAVTTEEISSKTAVENDPITFKVVDDVIVNGHTVIAKDATVKGIVTESEKSGRMGKSGRLNIRVESVTAVDGQPVKLRASKSGKGGDKTGSVIALSLLVSPLFLLKKGKDAKVKAGTKIKIFTDETKTVQAK